MMIGDDEPVISPAIADLFVDFTAGEDDDDSGFLDYGNDGGTFVITNFTALPDDTILGPITETLSDGDTVLTYSNATTDLFRLTLTDTEPGGVLFEVLSSAPVVYNELDFASVSAGGPEETEVVPGQAMTGTFTTFNGFLSSNFSGDAQAEFLAGNDPNDGNGGPLDNETYDDVNISNKGAALDDQQFDPGEQLRLTFSEDEAGTTSKDIEGVRVTFDGGTGNPNPGTFDVRFVAYDDGVLVGEQVFNDETLPKGNDTLVLEYQPNESFDELFIFQNFDGDNGDRIKSIELLEAVETPDFEVETTVRATDGDTDFVEDTFVTQIDGDHDGLIVV
jgi:hypothetical protein